MNNNLYNIPNDWYNINNNSNDLVTPKEGLEKGNLFSNLYKPYKNYTYGKLTPTNKKEELLFNILKYTFALNELDLYLDIYPDDTKFINIYNNYLQEEQKLLNEFIKMYGPITLNNNNNSNEWDWNKSPWPWEGTK